MAHSPALAALILTRSGRFAVDGPPGVVPEPWLQALDVELARLGYVLGHAARRRVGALDPDGFRALHTWLVPTLTAAAGADTPMEPLFRRFPEDVPADTQALWWQKFVGFYLQGADQPCLWCSNVGSTHVLDPCGHVVCDVCFDGSSYTACPVCERAVDRTSPFFRPGPSRPEVPSPVRLKRLDVTEDPDGEGRALLARLLARPQVLSPTDLDALRTLVTAFGARVLPWLPAEIRVRENVAHVFAALLAHVPAGAVLDAARPYLRTATDVLRLVAAWSGAEPSLQVPARRIPLQGTPLERWRGEPRRLAEGGLAALTPQDRRLAQRHPDFVPMLVATNIESPRFKVAKMGRPLRRALLALLDGLPEDPLLADVARHRSAWVGVGERLHPGEYADRFPRAHRAFEVARGAKVVTFAAEAERLREAGDVPALTRHLATRPGELWRRADDTLRRAADPAPVLAALTRTMSEVPLPLLLSLSTLLPPRDAPWPVRVFFPKGAFFHAPSAPDRRRPLPRTVTGPLVAAIEGELLARLGRLPRLPVAVIDSATEGVVVPFNERTAARGAVALPRGSSVALPEGERLRLFLHWCEPTVGGGTDIDLSLALYDAAWRHTGVCSYYQLNLAPIAVHSGDRRDAPPPNGAAEFVDLDRAAALRAGHRYAVMVVSHYSGLPFSELSRAWAGVMRRRSGDGPTFDPATVELRFDVAGAHGVFVPLVVDLESGRMHWLDVVNDGAMSLNNVSRSNRAITRVVPATLSWFGHGVRPSMRDLALLHAAARCDEIRLRGAITRRFLRAPGEGAAAFLARVRLGVPDATDSPPLTTPTFAALVRGDVELPEGSEVWALFRDWLTNVRSASDLLITP